MLRNPEMLIFMSRDIKKHTFQVKRKNGALVIECQMKVLIIHDRDLALSMIVPSLPKEGETITFQTKKVKSNA